MVNFSQSQCQLQTNTAIFVGCNPVEQRHNHLTGRSFLHRGLEHLNAELARRRSDICKHRRDCFRSGRTGLCRAGSVTDGRQQRTGLNNDRFVGV